MIGGYGISRTRAFYREKPPGFWEQSPFPEENENPGLTFSIGNVLFCTLKTLGIAIIPGKNFWEPMIGHPSIPATIALQIEFVDHILFMICSYDIHAIY